MSWKIHITHCFLNNNVRGEALFSPCVSEPVPSDSYSLPPQGKNMPVKSSFLTVCDLSLHFYLIILFHEERGRGGGCLVSLTVQVRQTLPEGAVSRLATTECWNGNFIVMLSLLFFSPLFLFDFVHGFIVAQICSLSLLLNEGSIFNQTLYNTGHRVQKKGWITSWNLIYFSSFLLIEHEGSSFNKGWRFKPFGCSSTYRQYKNILQKICTFQKKRIIRIVHHALIMPALCFLKNRAF